MKATECLFAMNPYDVPASTALTQEHSLHVVRNACLSSIVFLFSFFSLGAIAKTSSLTFAYNYTLEMVKEHFVSLLLPMCVLYASLDAVSRAVRKTPKSVFWPVISGTASFLLFNRVWDFTNPVAEFLRGPLRGIVDESHLQMVFLPAMIAIILEIVLVCVRRALHRCAPHRHTKAA
jgi:hypothetical protein